jgi:hypothetical protein
MRYDDSDLIIVLDYGTEAPIVSPAFSRISG